jgi:hypothetical protein
MPHIQLTEGVPGILGPMLFRPETAKPLNELAEVLLRGPNSLSRADRELIAAAFCMYNRYVDGLATWAPDDPELYRQQAAQLATEGYVDSTDRVSAVATGQEG